MPLKKQLKKRVKDNQKLHREVFVLAFFVFCFCNLINSTYYVGFLPQYEREKLGTLETKRAFRL
jgi:hypothetical protein